MRGARLPARIPRRLPRLLLALGAVGGGILVAGLGIGQRYSQGLQEDLAQLSARMSEAHAQQRQLLGDLQAAQQALSAAQSRLEAQEGLLKRESRAERSPSPSPGPGGRVGERERSKARRLFILRGGSTRPMIVSRKRAERLARQGAIEAHSRELCESLDEMGGARY